MVTLRGVGASAAVATDEGGVDARCQIAVRALPPGTVEGLVFSHVVELSRVQDGATRSLLAQATVENQWSSRQLRDAARAALNGTWIDGDPAPGLQPPSPEPEEGRPPQLGRVVSRFERSAEELESLSGQWRQLADRKLSGAQKSRMKQAIARQKAQLAEVEEQLG